MPPGEPYERLTKVLDDLLLHGDLKAVLLVDKQGQYVVARGDSDTMELVAETHFKQGLSLASLNRDADGCTVVSDQSGDAVRFEAVVRGRLILAFVSADPLAASRARHSINLAKAEIDKIFADLMP